MTKLSASNCDKTKLTFIVTKLNNSNYDKTEKLKFKQESRTQMVNIMKNSNCNKTLNSKSDITIFLYSKKSFGKNNLNLHNQ